MEFFCRTIFVVDNFFWWCVLEFNFPLKKKDWKQRTRWTQARRTQQFSDKTDQKHLISKKKVEVRMGPGKTSVWLRITTSVLLRITILWKMLYFKLIIFLWRTASQYKNAPSFWKENENFHTHFMSCAHSPRGEENRFAVTFLWHITTVGFYLWPALFRIVTGNNCISDKKRPSHSIYESNDNGWLARSVTQHSLLWQTQS